MSPPIRPAPPTHWGPTPAPTPQPVKPEPSIGINPGVLVSSHAVNILRDILRDAGLSSATITSGRRTVEDQARIMYTNLRTLGVARQRDLYRTSGNKVIDTYEAALQAGKTADQIRSAMVATMLEIGPSNVSNHINPSYDTFDVATSSIDNASAFAAALARAASAGRIKGFITEGKNMAYHLDVERIDR
jgi:hypothetical protein